MLKRALALIGTAVVFLMGVGLTATKAAGGGCPPCPFCR